MKEKLSFSDNFHFTKDHNCYQLNYASKINIDLTAVVTTNAFFDPEIRPIDCEKFRFQEYICIGGLINDMKFGFDKDILENHFRQLDLTKTVNSSLCHKQNSYQCPDFVCINSLYVCDGQMDCPDGDDEKNCTESYDFRCDDGRIIKIQFVCNYIKDCLNGEDEEFCGKLKISL